ncbi:MAG: DUF4252 domain-containing protein [Cyclobacteriaceae bacterium]|nr:DUF4252 domain-containing protein [Cyclobacteriaceae bacterium]
MKKLILIAVMMVGAMGAFAQNDAISRFFAKYQDDESFSQVTVSSKMFNLFTDMEVESKDDQEVLNAISRLKGLRILHKEKASDARSLYKEAFSLIPTKEYEELLTVRDKDQDMKFFIKEIGKGKIGELLMVMGGNDEFMILSLFGEIDLKQVSHMGRKMNIDGLKNLEKIDEHKDKKEKKEQKDEE